MPTLASRRVAGSYYVGKHPNSAANLLRGLPKPKKPTKPKRTSKFKGEGQNPNSWGNKESTLLLLARESEEFNNRYGATSGAKRKRYQKMVSLVGMRGDARFNDKHFHVEIIEETSEGRLLVKAALGTPWMVSKHEVFN